MTDDETSLAVLPLPDDESLGDTLNPRQRKLCELAAQGRTNNQICAELGYSTSRVSILLHRPEIRRQVEKLQNYLFEETVVKRLKQLGDAAVSNIEECVTDQRNRYKPEMKIEVSKWVIEKLDGKPAQKIDVGENLLGAMLDRLDHLKTSGKTLSQAPASDPSVIDVTPSSDDPPPPKPPVEPESEEWLTDWVTKNV
jgi:hypothetical protein